MKLKHLNFNQFLDFINFYKRNRFLFNPYISEYYSDDINFYKKGNKINIKKENKGKFTEYCKGNITSECISKGKNSPDPKIRKRATFAANSKLWNKSK